MAHDAQIERLERRVMARLDTIISLLDLTAKTETIMATLADIQTKVAAQKTVIDGAIELLNGLAEKVRNLPATQAAIDQLAADIDANTQPLAAAVVADTIADTPPGSS